MEGALYISGMLLLGGILKSALIVLDSRCAALKSTLDILQLPLFPLKSHSTTMSISSPHYFTLCVSHFSSASAVLADGSSGQAPRMFSATTSYQRGEKRMSTATASGEAHFDFDSQAESAIAAPGERSPGAG